MQSRLHQIGALFLGVVLAMGVLTPPSTAQVLYGSLTGVVTDQTGATVPGAEVTATNTLTGRVATTSTDAEGRYSFVNIQAGLYDIKVAADGFRTLTQTGTTVSVSKWRVDLSLELGQVTES
ncbi:MAG: carboxypeptidase-like regulatory domain-containing protein [Bryobacterales bacterium]